MAFGGVLITKGIPSEAAIAIKIAVEGAGPADALRGNQEFETTIDQSLKTLQDRGLVMLRIMRAISDLAH
jgi:hypothetical protein